MNLKHLSMDDRKIITGLDLGSQSVKCVMAQIQEDQIEVIGSAEVVHQGIQHQQIANTQIMGEAIRQVCQEVEVVSERQITELWVSISNPFHLFSSAGMAIITGGQVNKKHILQSIATARAVPLPDHQEVVHILPTYFKVDRKEKVFTPVGLSGLRLETSVLLVTSDTNGIQDLQRCISFADRKARGYVIQSLASGLSVTNQEDKNQGVCVLDIGKHCSQMCVFANGRVVYMSQIPFGGNDITGDIVHSLKVSPAAAEQLKIQYGLPSQEYFSSSLHINEGATIYQKDLYDALAQSMSQGFASVQQDLESKGLDHLIYNGIILTGGGSRLKNISAWARSYFNKPVSIKQLSSFGGQIKYGTALGLIQYAKDDRLDFKENIQKDGLSITSWFKDLLP